MWLIFERIVATLPPQYPKATQQQPGVGAFLPAPAPANKSGSTTLLSRINFLVLIVDCSALQLRGRHGHRRSDQVHPGPQGHGQDPLGDRQERGGRRSKEAFQIVELLHVWSRYRSLFSMLTWFSKRFFFIDYIFTILPIRIRPFGLYRKLSSKRVLESGCM